MSVTIKTKDGQVSITADEGSTVRNIRVDGKDVIGGSGYGGDASWWTITKRASVYLSLLMFCVLCWGCSRLAHASPAECEFIKDADRRHYCRAISIPRKSECEFIKDNDMRHECRARVTK